MTQLAINIRAFRKRNKITQDQLASHCKVSGAAVSQWESVKNPTLPDLPKAIAMAELFRTSVEHLYSAKDIEVGAEENYVLSPRLVANIFSRLFQNAEIQKVFMNGRMSKKVFMFNNLFGLYSSGVDDNTLNDSEVLKFLGLRDTDPIK